MHGAFRPKVQKAALKMIGLVPFTMAPIFDSAIRHTVGTPDITARLQNDVDSIKMFVDDENMDAAGEELVKQLMGSKFSTGKCRGTALQAHRSE